MRILYLEYLRLIASIAVVAIHVISRASYVLGSNINSNLSVFSTAISIDAFFRFCVPIFFMISGSLILRKDDLDIKKFLISRFKRVVIPVIVWGYAYSFWFNRTFTFAEHTKNVLLGNGFYHLWFLYSIIGLYLAVPIIFKFVKNSKKIEIETMLIIGVICNTLIPVISKYFYVDLGSVLNLNYVAGYMIYFILGYYLYEYDLKLFNNKLKSTIMYLLSTAMIIFFTLETSIAQGGQEMLFIHYSWILVFIQTVSVFTLFKQIKFKNSDVTKVSSLFMGIYILHIFILEGYQKMWNIDYATLEVSKYLLYVVLGIIYTYIVSVAISYLLKKTPVIKNLL